MRLVAMMREAERGLRWMRVGLTGRIRVQYEEKRKAEIRMANDTVKRLLQ
jgi:hypothetical protein